MKGSNGLSRIAIARCSMATFGSPSHIFIQPLECHAAARFGFSVSARSMKTAAPSMSPTTPCLLQLGRNRAYHTGREAVLQIENVFNGAVESIGPEMRRGGRINKLGSDANPIIGSTDAAFEHVAHAQFATDLLHINGLALVRER